ncbi:MAG: TraR/DksA family transcriptional regulator [Geoalkalibacter sp.]|jgi:DnaK suppressor protein|uniref:TraR/DksA family transcriptional regulator n=1 Tax=Geoalkalibacter sp. TaxID=3041440 RepID=UPI003D0CA19A
MDKPKMPEDSLDEREEYMNHRHREYFRNRLLNWRKNLLAQDRELRRSMRQEHLRQADLLDQGVHDAGRYQILESHLRIRCLLEEIDAALSRIAEGSYGYCLETGEEIGLKRLKILPTAKHSVEIQEQQEWRARSRRRQGE